jgi:hypothetical protein
MELNIPSLTAGSFASFAHLATPRAKLKFVRDMVARQAPDYDPPPDYWFRLRTPLITMIRKNAYSSRAASAALRKTPKDRRDEFAKIWSGFLGTWPPQRPNGQRRPRLRVALDGLTISCLPHAAVLLDERLWFLRFVYPISPRISSKAITEYQILCVATRDRAAAGLLHVPSGAVLTPNVPPHIDAFIAAEAAEYVRLWKRHRSSA